MAKRTSRKLLLAGGGTLGPVTPLLAVADVLRREDRGFQFVWVGTRFGPEREVVKAADISFLHLPPARLTRYPSLEWILLPFRFLQACFMAFLILGREKPDAVASGGGYTGVPIVLAAFLRRIPVWIHQPDVEPLLTSRLTAPFAKLVTVAWASSLKDFPARKTVCLGNPVRPAILHGAKDRAFEKFHLDLKLPTVLVLGGGTGSAWINDVFAQIGASLMEKANVIHVTGEGKSSPALKRLGDRYHVAPLLNETDLADAYAAADLVIARAGMGTISELAALGKATILIPLPASAQEQNARVLEKSNAAIVWNQSSLTASDLRLKLLALLDDAPHRKELSKRIRAILPPKAEETIAAQVRATLFS